MTRAEQDSKIILARLEKLFKPKDMHRYRIDVVNNRYGQCYNFFFDVYHDKKRERSYPLHSMFDYQIEHLEKVIELVMQETNLTLAYRGFENIRWTDGRLIQRKTKDDTQS